MSVIYIIGKVLTLPGTYMKTFWEHMVCKLLNIPVEPKGYLNLDEGLGHVEHAPLAKNSDIFLLNLLPGLINFVLGLPMFVTGVMGLAFLGVGPVIWESNSKTWIFYIYIGLLYLGISLLSNLFPLLEDAFLLKEKVYDQGNKAGKTAKIFLALPGLIMLIGAYVEKYALNVLILVLIPMIVYLV